MEFRLVYISLYLLFSCVVFIKAISDSEKDLIYLLKKYIAEKRGNSWEPGCGGTPQQVYLDSGSVTSPTAANGNYPTSRHCAYQLNVDPGKRIRIKFTKLDLQYEQSCSNDYVNIYEGTSESGPKLGWFCGTWNTMPNDVVSSGNKVLIVFHSDAYTTKTGFKVLFNSEGSSQPSVSEPGCSGSPQQVYLNSGEVTNPTLSDGNYPANRHCAYQLNVDPGKKIYIKFVKVDLEYDSSCNKDYVNIYDGTSESSFKLGWYCGTWTTSPKDLVSSGNKVLIVFHSNGDVNKSGFKLKFSTEPIVTETPSAASMGCGKNKYMKRIFGGEASKLNEWPWIVHIRTKYPPAANMPDTYFNQCGGVLITPQWVLTAAHCMEHSKTKDRTTDPRRVSLYLGEHNTQQWDKSQFLVEAAKIIIHSGRTGFDVDKDDIALIKLASPVTLAEHVNTVCMPYSDSQFKVGQECSVAGWGKQGHIGVSVSPTLMHINLKIISNSQCDNVYGWQDWAMPINKDHICGMNEGNTKSFCQGDSGGPLVCLDGGSYYVAGIVSWGAFCGTSSNPQPSVFARVTSYTGWIQQTINNN